jgi:hypothetical protein
MVSGQVGEITLQAGVAYPESTPRSAPQRLVVILRHPSQQVAGQLRRISAGCLLTRLGSRKDWRHLIRTCEVEIADLRSLPGPIKQPVPPVSSLESVNTKELTWCIGQQTTAPD